MGVIECQSLDYDRSIGTIQISLDQSGKTTAGSFISNIYIVHLQEKLAGMVGQNGLLSFKS